LFLLWYEFGREGENRQKEEDGLGVFGGEERLVPCLCIMGIEIGGFPK